MQLFCFFSLGSPKHQTIRELPSRAPVKLHAYVFPLPSSAFRTEAQSLLQGSFVLKADQAIAGGASSWRYQNLRKSQLL